MNATTNFTVKSLRANKVRTLVTIAGVALAAALLTAVLTTYVSLNDFLYRSEAHLAGTWMACVEADGSSALDEKIADAQADSQVSGTAIMRDIGFAELTADQQDTQGTYLAIRSIEGDVGDICGIAPSEGRLPENEHEIMLFATWNDYDGVSLGDAVTFNVGQRVARLAPGEEGSMSAGTMTASWVQRRAHESEITDGTPLNSSMGVLRRTSTAAPSTRRSRTPKSAPTRWWASTIVRATPFPSPRAWWASRAEALRPTPLPTCSSR